jgi:ferritin-like metal-binding protein YciE
MRSPLRALCSLATAVGLDNVAELMSETLKEEKTTDETLTALAETVINPE